MGIMIPRPSHITATVRKLVPRDPRDPEVMGDHMAAAKASVRAGRIIDLHNMWQERNLEAFDYLVEFWHRMDPALWKHLCAEPENKSPQDRAQKVLEKAGWL